MKRISDRISFLPSTDNPLSAEVYVIHGNSMSYVVDVGSSDEAYKLVNSIEKKIVIITHFHDDHMKNIRRIEISDENLFVGTYTGKVLAREDSHEDNIKHFGTVVTSAKEISDGVKVHIVPIPSSHAKGSLGVIVDDEYLLMGDAFYCSAKGYNVSLLAEEIRCLKKLVFSKMIMSHDEKNYTKDEVLSELERIYERRVPGNPLIMI